jgi:hypothetical protein
MIDELAKNINYDHRGHFQHRGVARKNTVAMAYIVHSTTSVYVYMLRLPRFRLSNSQ